MTKTSVKLENGKYTFEVHHGVVSCKRFGEPWIKDLDCPGIKGIIGLIHECEEAQEASLQNIDTRAKLWFSRAKTHYLEANVYGHRAGGNTISENFRKYIRRANLWAHYAVLVRNKKPGFWMPFEPNKV